MIDRRQFLKALGIGAAGLVLPTELILPERKVWALDRTMVQPVAYRELDWLAGSPDDPLYPCYELHVGDVVQRNKWGLWRPADIARMPDVDSLGIVTSTQPLYVMDGRVLATVPPPIARMIQDVDTALARLHQL